MNRNTSKYKFIRKFLCAAAYLLGMGLTTNAQHITSKGSYLEGTSYISTSRVQVLHSKNKFASTITLSMDYIHVTGNGHFMKEGDSYDIQMNFFERNVGQKLLLKCENGDVIELQTQSIQRDPFVQIYVMSQEKVEKIINGKVKKIRIMTYEGFVDREVKGNEFSDGVERCYELLRKTSSQDKENEKKFKDSF